MNPLLIKSFIAAGALAAYRFVKPGAADGAVLLSAAVGDAIIGSTNEVGAAINERQDVVLAGVGQIECGGAITRGDWLTSDATGKALAAAPAAGVNNNVGGRALVSGVAGDIIPYVIAQGRIQG